MSTAENLAVAAAEALSTNSKAITFQTDPYELLEDDYELGKRLGRGSFATVYLARHKATDKKVVVKRLDRIQQHQEDQVQNEVDMMKQAGWHPNLVSYKGHYRTRASNILCIVMGYCEGGTLADVLKSMESGVYLTEEQIMGWFIQLVMAVHHLHERNIIHRDLKPGNIFLNKTHTIIRVGDMGISKSMSNSIEMATTMMGTPYYMSPELMASRPYSTKSDIWSLGCILYEMAARKTAFEAKGMPQLMVKILRNAYQPLPSYLSRQFAGLVGSMLRSDPEVRPAALQLLQLPFVRIHAERQLDQPISPQIDAALIALIEAPMDVMAERRSDRPITAMTMRTSYSRPKTSKSKGQSKSGAVKQRTSRNSKIGKLGKTQNPNLQTVKLHHETAKQWDAGAQYELRQAQMREMRHQAREMEQRLGREVARQRRKATDPQERAKEERKQRQLRALMKERQRRKIAEEEAAILRAVVGEEAALEGTAAAFRTFDKLGRTMPGIPGNKDEAAGAEDEEVEEAAKLPMSPGAHDRPCDEAAGVIPTAVAAANAAGIRIRNLLDELDKPEDTRGVYEGLTMDDYDAIAEDDYLFDSDENEDSEDEEDEDDEEEGEEGLGVEAEGEQESEELMENKLAEVWESNPMERMNLLEQMWQQSLKKKKGGKGIKKNTTNDAQEEAPRVSDPNQMLGHLGSFFEAGGKPSSAGLAKSVDAGLLPHAPKSLPPLRGSPRHSAKTSDGASEPEKLQPKSALKKSFTRPSSVESVGEVRPGGRHIKLSVDESSLPSNNRGELNGRPRRASSSSKYGDVSTAFSPSEDDALMGAIELRKILTHKTDDSSPGSTPSPQTPSVLAPLQKSGRHASGTLMSSNISLNSLQKESLKSANQVSKLLSQIASKGNINPGTAKGKRNRRMAGDMMLAFAASSMKDLVVDSLLDEDEDADEMGAQLLDPSLPEKMLDLEQRQRVSAGDPLYMPAWTPADLNKEAGSEEGDRGVSFFVPNSPPRSGARLPKIENQPRKSVQIVDPPIPEPPKLDKDLPKPEQDSAEALMLTAVQDQMREIRRWRDTLVSGRTSHELAALELMDRAATINSSGLKSHNNSVRSISTAGDKEESDDDSDDEVINL